MPESIASPDTDAEGLEEIIDRHYGLIQCAFLIRRAEEKLLELFAKGLVNGTVHTCVGQEFIGAAVASELQADDFIASNHRGHGHFLARTGDLEGLFAEVCGRTTGVSGGVGGSQHLRAPNFLSNGIQGGMCPVAAGAAMARQISGSNAIAVVYLGDGTLGEGIVYETFNICSNWNLPVLFILESNGYAQSTSSRQTFSGDVSKRAEGFGLTYSKTSTWCLDDLCEQVSASVLSVRNSDGPRLLEIETYRLNSHSKGDDNRPEAEVDQFRRRDILTQLMKHDIEPVTQMLQRVDAAIENAVEAALAGPVLVEYSTGSDSSDKHLSWIPVEHSHDSTHINELIHQSLNKLLQEDPTSLILGEDIEYTTAWTPKPYGGAFKVTRDLSARFPGRVRNTPISEAAVIGIGTGLALCGFRSVVEIMFGDFLTLGFDQLVNHATKFCEMYGVRQDVPLTIRTAMGGRRAYGPTHSQSLEKHFLGIPNLSVIALNHRVSPELVYESVFKLATPALIIENKVLYTRALPASPIPGYTIEQSTEEFPAVRIRPATGHSADVTILCYGGMLEVVEEAISLAFHREEILCNVFCPTQISPIRADAILDSLTGVRRLLIVEEGPSTAGWGSEIVSTLTQSRVTLDAIRHLAHNGIIPCSAAAEQHALPGPADIVDAICGLMREGCAQ